MYIFENHSINIIATLKPLLECFTCYKEGGERGNVNCSHYSVVNVQKGTCSGYAEVP